MSETSTVRSRSSTSTSNVDSETNLLSRGRSEKKLKNSSISTCEVSSPELDHCLYHEDNILKETNVFSIIKHLSPSKIENKKENELPSITPETSFLCLCLPLRIPTEELNEDLKIELKKYIGMTRMNLDYENHLHILILEEYYKNVTNEKLPDLKGKHWEDIGFLGPDVQKEIRGMGVFGLCFLLYISQVHPEFCQKLFTLSKNEKKKFDFSIVVLHISLIVLNQLKSGHMNNYLNKESSIRNSTFLLFIGLLEEFYDIWNKNNFKDDQFHQLLETKIKIYAEKKWKLIIEKKKKKE
eukprot:gene1171-10685_t